MAKVVMENISKSFGTVHAATDFNLTVEDKEFPFWLALPGVENRLPSVWSQG